MSKKNCIVQFLELIENIPLDENGCKNWPMGISKTGYGVYSICNFTYSVPRLVYNTLRDGFYRDGLIVRHKCDNRKCCNIDHLEIGTQSDNMQDCLKRGRKPVGEKSNLSKFTNDQVIEIRNYYPQKSTVEIAKEFNTFPSVIRSIIIGKSWNHISGAKELHIYKRALGEKMGMSKLTEKQVIEIRKKYPDQNGPELAKEYGVGHAMIYAIIKRKNWTHI